jgi:hypothetical protein
MLETAVKVSRKGWRIAGKLNLGNVELSRTSSAFTLHYACGWPWHSYNKRLGWHKSDKDGKELSSGR